MTRYLIVNADDFGRSPGASRGILDGHKKGIVTSTSAMMGYPNTAQDLETALSEAPNLGIGLHFTLTGKMPPVSAATTIPTLATRGGHFRLIQDFLGGVGEIAQDEVEAEMRAQFEKFRAVTGRLPDHLDGHYNCVYLIPQATQVLFALATEHHLPIRNPGYAAGCADMLRRSTGYASEEWIRIVAPQLEAQLPANLTQVGPAVLLDGFYDKTATLGDLLLILMDLDEGASELMCHPGYVDEALNSPYREGREAELAALTHKSTQELIKAQGIELTNYGHFQVP